MSVLRDNGGHMDIYHLYLRARERESRLSLATVYRTLRLLVERGLVRQRAFDGDRFYEMAKPLEHHHLLCLGCGAIVELKPVMGRDEEELLDQIGIELVEIEVILKGYCPACSEGRRRGGKENLAPIGQIATENKLAGQEVQ